ncbi:AAA family ATPase [Lactococcus petauri]|uniref:AAA family ATPase n=1 Tax=Lactococcus petauri TaxID=1940789 RepID=UPI0038524B06
MFLTKVKLNGLFGIFNHEIDLSNEGISIVIGENGVGKTYLLEAINSLFNLKLSFFTNLEFKDMVFEFDDNIQWVVEKIEKEEENSSFSISEYSQKKLINHQKIPLDMNLSSLEIRRQAAQIALNVPTLERVGPTRFINHANKMIFTANELVNEYSDMLIIDENIDYKDIEKWILDRITYNKTRLIETQRIYTFVNNEGAGYSETIMRYASDLSSSISSIENQYSQESSKLDESFPYRLINKIRKDRKNDENNTSKIESLSEALVELDDRRSQLKNIGLLTNEDSKKIQKGDISLAQEAIELYIEDSNKKFDVYKELQTKISLFLKIINKRFSHKKLQIDKEKGFIFKQLFDSGIGEQEIPVRRLSSGEKNELILFYDLLFKSDDVKLVLIDEPEISLHVSWQSLFINDIQDIHKLNGINVLIATHSPDIIGGNWHLTNELGKSKEK